MLSTINKIRAAFSLPAISELAQGETNREIVEKSLGQGSKLRFGAGTNWIDVFANEDTYIASNHIPAIVNRLESDMLEVFVSREDGMPCIITPDDIRDFLKQ